jgi:hypothetical protein
MKDLFTKTADVLFGAATALDVQWCDRDKQVLRELAKAFSEGVKCCSERTFNIEFAHSKDSEYVRCSKCGYSYGSAIGFLIASRLSREENHKLFYENAFLRNEVRRLARNAPSSGTAERA